MDISTISRVVNSKYIETPYGIKSLKYYFSESISKSDGESVSVTDAHADNIAPCLLGGLTLIRDTKSLDIINIPITRYKYTHNINRKVWRKNNALRIGVFWIGSLLITALVILIIASDWITWDRLNRDFVASTGKFGTP